MKAKKLFDRARWVGLILLNVGFVFAPIGLRGGQWALGAPASYSGLPTALGAARGTLNDAPLSAGWAPDAAALEAGDDPLPSAPSALPGDLMWQTQCVDCPPYFSNLGNHSLRLDAANRVHLAFGGDHLYYAVQDTGAWQIQTVDPVSDVGQYASLALDSAGYPHISYSGARLDTLKYASWTGTEWKIETVDEAGRYVQATSLALDATGQAHIAYVSISDHDFDSLRYARWNGTAWEIQVLVADVGQYAALALDGTGQPHIAYCLGSFGSYGGPGPCYRLQYAYWRDGTWHFDTIDPEGPGLGPVFALVVDPAGHAHVSYYDKWHSDLIYAYWTGSEWVREVVDGEGSVGSHSALALSAYGRPHIAYFDGANGDLKYAHKADDGWHVGTIDSNGWAGEWVALALDPADNAHVSYLARQSNPAPGTELRHGHWTGTAWQFETIVSAGHVGLSPSLTLDGAGRPYMSYYDFNNDDLKYAQWTGMSWSIQTVDSTGNVGWGSSLALDADGRAQIAYFDTSDSPAVVVKHARWTGSNWNFTTIDAPALNDEVSLALDASGNPHVAYQESEPGTPGKLKYAWWNGNAWEIQVVESSDQPDHRFGTASLALDDASRPHISYHGVFTHELRYAQWNGTGWVTETVDSSNTTPYWDPVSSLALDPAGRPRIAYSNDNREVRYAAWTGSNWEVQPVWDIQAVGGAFLGDIRLVLDGAGQPHIAFTYGYVYGSTNTYAYAIRYARWTGSAWHAQAGPPQARGLSITLDSAGQPHLAYYDSVTRDLRYAVGVPAVHYHLPLVFTR